MSLQTNLCDLRGEYVTAIPARAGATLGSINRRDRRGRRDERSE